MKVYKDPKERSFKNTEQYLVGKFYRKLSQRKAVAKNNKFAKKLKHENWIKREFFMLEKLYNLGAKIPKPILHIENAIFMEFLGGAEIIAPRLCDIKLTKQESEKALDSIIETVLVFWNFGVVHADLSEYNILWWNNCPYIIDFPQSINKETHPCSDKILERDLKNVVNYFSKSINVDYFKIKERFI